MSDGLTDKELLFAKEYAAHGRASYAAKKAGYSAKSDKALSVSANRLLKRPRVREAIEKLGRSIGQLAKKPIVDDVREVVVTRNILTQRADEIYQAAFKSKQFSSALNALRFMAEMHQIVVSESNTVNNNFTLNLLDNDDRSARAKTINGSVSTEAAPDHQATRTL